MPEQIGRGKFCAKCGRERYYAKGLCGACYQQARRGEPRGPRPVLGQGPTPEESAAKRRETWRRYAERHPERLREKDRVRRSAPGYAEKNREWSRQWRAANPERWAELRKRYYEAHREEILARSREWNRTHRELLRKAESEYRAKYPGREQWRRIKREGRLLMAIYERDKGLCGLCGLPVPAEEMSIDHIIPIRKAGTNEPDNLQLAHVRCNQSKGGA